MNLAHEGSGGGAAPRERARRQVAPDVLLVRPRHFGYNPETAASNRFQSPPHGVSVQALALAEHEALAHALRTAGVGVFVMDDADEPLPDAVFPNNWVSFHEDGTVILYPMQAPSRRAERRPGLVAQLAQGGGFRSTRLVDLSPLEERGLFLEGTGSLVLDHVHRVAYAALSERTHEAAVAAFARETGFEPLVFRTADEAGTPLYHTNVLLSIGERHAVICAEVIRDRAERRAVCRRLVASGRELVEIDARQMRAFAANVLELAGGAGPVVAMSAAARAALRPDQFERLASRAALVAVPVPTIERVGGGSVRCMLAEVFLPRGADEAGPAPPGARPECAKVAR